MRISTKPFAFAAVLTGGLIAAPFIYAHDAKDSERGGAMMDQRTIGPRMMGQGMMGMMDTMEPRMMDQCAGMMRDMSGGPGNPNDQWRGKAPAPDKKG